MGQDKQQPLSAETDDWVFSSGISLGALLKNQREKMGLSHAQISQQTCLRPHILEAIENGDWHLLPAPTLVKGFIRAYARALALEEDRLIDLYNEESGTPHFPDKLLLPPIHGKNKWPLVVTGLLVFLAVLMGGYAWMQYSISPKADPESDAVSVRDLRKTETPMVPDEQRMTETTPVDEPTPASDVEAELTEDISSVNPETPESPDTLPVPVVTQNADGTESEAENLSVSEAVETFTWRLKGYVTERTWLRISIDGRAPKEHIFVPSDQPEWKAKKGFELLIGNAGGIALEFNGKKMDNLGKQGQVVRIKLPEDEERSTPKN